jgi:hypothetical protein
MCGHRLRFNLGVFKTYFPKLFDFYQSVHNDILDHYPDNTHINKDLPFAAMTANLGPQTVTKIHCDYKNLVFRVCLNLACSQFNHKKGGHFLLHEPHVSFEMAQGEFGLSPSSFIQHSNLPISPSKV